MASERLEVVFGAPVAQEDHAIRAVLAALMLQQQWASLARALTLGSALHLGLHTGAVVVEPTGQAYPTPLTVVGEVPRVATLLAQQAPPDTVLVSEATARGLHDSVRVEPLAPLPVAGEPQPLQVYRVLASQMAPVLYGTRWRTHFVGREEELAVLRLALLRVMQGHGQAVGILGEPGLGKTRLLAEFQRHLADQPVTLLTSSCHSYTQTTPYLPLLTLLRQQCRLPETEAPARWAALLRHHFEDLALTAEDWAPYLGHLLGLPEATAQVAGLSPHTLRARTMAALYQVWYHSSRRQPLVVVVENLHWIDASSEAYLTSLVERLAEMAVLLLVTYRPGYVPPWLTTVGMLQLPLGPLSAADGQQIVADVWRAQQYEAPVPPALLARAAGNPLFLEELAQAAVPQAGATTPAPIPETVQAVLAARLDQLAPEVKRLVQIAAVIGTDIPLALLQPAAGLAEEALDEALRQLQRAALLYETPLAPEPGYTFKHVLIQEVAYQSLLKRTRQQVHGHVAQLLVERMPALVASQPELLAQHYTAAGLAAQAVDCWQRAGQRASDRSAHVEAISHYSTGTELLKTLPATPERTQQALTLYIALGAALLITKGQAVPEVEHAYTQARALCQQVGETPALVPVLFGLWRFYVARPQLHTARELGDTLLRLAHRAHDPALAVLAHYALGVTWWCLGVVQAACQHLEAGIARYTPDQRRAPVFRIGHDPGVACRFCAAMTCWSLGYPAQALARLHEALALAHALSHPYSLAFAQSMAAWVSQLRRDVPAVHAHAEAAITLSTEQGFPLWAAYGTIFRGWALAMQGQGEAGMAQVRQGIASFRATGQALIVPYLCTVLADVAAHLGHTEDGLQALAEAHTLVEQQEERWWEAEVARLRGVVLLRQPGIPQGEAEAWLQRALDVARRQEAKSLELRAAMSLSRLWQQQGQQVEAHELLAPIYGWFTEGFDTADLQEAKALLEALA